MLENLRALQASLRELDKSLRKVATTQVRSKPLADQVRALVDHYFRNVRPSIASLNLPQVGELDATMQALLEASHKHVRPGTYRDLIRTAVALALDLEKVALLAGPVNLVVSISAVDRRIIDTLARLVPSAALSYEQALVDLQGPPRRSWRGPATDLREALRETLDYLAPDKDVMAQPGFKLEKEVAGPTMKQKVRYVLSKRGISKTATEVSERAASSVEDIVGSFVRSIYSRSNLSTHTPTDKNEVTRVRDWVRVALCEILQVPT